MLSYSLSENQLTAAPNDFKAVPVNVRSFNMSEIVQRIMARNPGLSPAQINSSIDEFFKEISIIVGDGGAINTPLFNTQPSIAGVFHGAVDTFDARRHRVKTNITSGTMMHRATDEIRTQKVQIAEPLPFILEVHDVVSETVNEEITPGGVLQIRGGRLRLITENPANGIFLIGDDGQDVKLPTVIENKPSRLIAMIPADLPTGDYSLEVRTTFSTANRETRTIKTGRFNRELTAVCDETTESL